LYDRPVSDVVPLAGEWNLWRDFAVRSAGFPVSGLATFGPGDESERLAAIASDARFQEAVTWQNPAALANAVLKVASRAPTKPPSRARGREEIVASYWQRYCGKNDTIGFFGPLAWGRIEDDGPLLHAESGVLVRNRHVHLESWGVQAVAEALDPELGVARGPHPERDLRAALDAHPDADVRTRGTHALDRLESAQAAVANAPPGQLRDALAQLDAVFTDLTSQDAVRNPGMAYGARTLCYLDCMRDLDVTVGPDLVAAMAPALQALFEACRWWSGQVDAMCRRVVEGLLPDGGRGPFMPVLGQTLGTLMQHPPGLADELAELHRRLQAVLADHQPSWRHGVFNSVDIQVAARDEQAVANGEFLAVVGDAIPGTTRSSRASSPTAIPTPIA
jgi:hypothetical protein